MNDEELMKKIEKFEKKYDTGDLSPCHNITPYRHLICEALIKGLISIETDIPLRKIEFRRIGSMTNENRTR